MLKIGFAVLGAMLSALGGLFVWGIQKLASTLMENTTELIKLNSKVNEMSKHTDRVPKLESDINQFYARIRHLEINQGINNVE